MTKIQLKRSSALLSGSARVPAANQLDYGELAVNYNSTDPQLFYKDSGGNVVSFFEPYAPLSGATFTGDCTFNTDVDFDGAVTIQGDSTNGSGKLTLTCEQNTHAVNIKAPAHSASANYTLTLPSSTGSSGEVLSTDGSGGLSWAYAAMSTADKTKLDGIAAGAEVNVNADWNASSGDAQILNKPTIPTNNNQLTNGAGYITSFDITTQTDSKYLRSNANDTATGQITLERNNASATDFSLWIKQVAASARAQIRFSNNVTTQNGYFYYRHEDGSSNSAANSFHFDSDQAGVAVIIDDTGSNAGYYVGTNEVWHQGNDGSGSGLDADTVDGIQASSFLRSDASDSASGVITLTSSSQYPFVINSSHNGKIVLQGSASPYIRFRESSTDKAFIQWNSSGYFELRNTEDGSAIRIRDDIEFTNNNGTNWHNIWHASNDGSGSGLDADLLDGIQASSFLRSDANDTTTGMITIDRPDNSTWLDLQSASNGYARMRFFGYAGDPVIEFSDRSNGSGQDQVWAFGADDRNTGSMVIRWNGNTAFPSDWTSSGSEFFQLKHNGYLSLSGGEPDSYRLTVGGVAYASSNMRSPIFYDSNDTNYQTNPAGTSYVKYLGRRAHQTGHFVGGHNNIGTTSYATSPIYTIGSNYNPNETTLNNMYGIGFTHTNASFFSLSGQNGWGMYVAADGDARVQLSGTNGAISCTGNITAYASDQRLKTNIKPIDKALNKLMKISGVEYDWIDECESEYEFQPRQKHEIGVIAQEVQEVLPELVFEAPFNSLYKAKTGWKQIQKRLQDEEDQAASVEGREATEITKAIAKEAFEKLPLDERVSMCTDHQFLTVDYERLAPVLIEAIKELKQQVDSLANLYSK